MVGDDYGFERSAGIDTRVVIKYIPGDLLFVTGVLEGREEKNAGAS